MFCKLVLVTFFGTVAMGGELQPKREDIDIKIVSSNMPAAWQVDAASFLETSYRLHDTPYQVAELFSQLFEEKHNINQWEVVVNGESIYHHGQYNIKLSLIDLTNDREAQHLYYMFSSGQCVPAF